MNRGVERVWVGIGSNLLNPKNQAKQALYELSKIPMTKIVTCSSFYRSNPLKNKNQPDFLNAIVILDTYLYPEKFLEYTQYIEKKQGRKECSLIWESRTLDLDILLFGKYNICTNILNVPHYDLFNREFTIYPLMELDSNLVFPNNKTIMDIIKLVPRNGLSFWEI